MTDEELLKVKLGYIVIPYNLIEIYQILGKPATYILKTISILTWKCGLQGSQTL